MFQRFVLTSVVFFIACGVAFSQLPVTPTGDPQVSGKVSSEGQPLSNVTISFSGGPQAVTDSSGRYTVRVKKNYTGSVSAFLAGFSFAPAARTLRDLNADLADQDFTGINSGNSATLFALPQLAFGDGWYTALYFSNTTNSAVSVPVNFIGDNGAPLSVPLIGFGSAFHGTVNLNPGSTVVLEAPNMEGLAQGWVETALPPGVVCYAVFRLSRQGRADQEAVVPLTPESSQAADLIYDDTSLTTAVSLVNPSSQQVVVTVVVYGSDGAQIGSSQVTLAARSKQAVVLKSLPGLADAVGKRGWAAFSVPNGAISVLGLRFGGEAFTSIPVTHR